MNPHFIFNCLNSIQNFIALNDAENAMNYLAQFAKLVRGTLNASMAEKITLQEEVDLLENYLSLEKLRFKNQFDYVIEVAPDLDIFGVMLPPLLTQPFVENAIKHGFKKLKSKGHLEIRFLEKNRKLEIIIQDNGQGLFESQKNKSVHYPKQGGVGMSISQKRLELADLLNEFDVKEIKNKDGTIEGTLVKMILEL